jgi:hypothetical protein
MKEWLIYLGALLANDGGSGTYKAKLITLAAGTLLAAIVIGSIHAARKTADRLSRPR